MPIVLTVGTYSGVVGSLNRAFGVRDVVREIAKEDSFDSATTPEEDEAVLDLQEPVPPGVDGRIIRLANTILKARCHSAPSDIHLEPFEDLVRIRYRVDGELLEITPPPKSDVHPAHQPLQDPAKMDIAEKRIAAGRRVRREDRRRAHRPPRQHRPDRVRREDGHAAPATRRRIPLTLAKLGFDEQQIDLIDAIQAPHGLMFVTGPTGSGKSTTLYACLNLLNDPSTNICTVEDPVEYKLAGMNQVQVKSQVGLTFATALRAFLRQDPDVIMVGEVRDQETAEICLRARADRPLRALDAAHQRLARGRPRLRTWGSSRSCFRQRLRMVEAQRLVRRLCNIARSPIELDAKTRKRAGHSAGCHSVSSPRAAMRAAAPATRAVSGSSKSFRSRRRSAHSIQSRTPLPEAARTAQRRVWQLLRDAGHDQGQGRSHQPGRSAGHHAGGGINDGTRRIARMGPCFREEAQGHQSDDIFNFFQQLSTMIQAGMPLMDALELSAEQTPEQKARARSWPRSREKVGTARRSPPHAQEYPKIFESHWVQVIRTGEISGQIGPLLGGSRRNMKESREASGKLHQRDDLPVDHLLSSRLRRMVIMLWFVVPTFTQFFNETGTTLPGITRFVIGMSSFFQHFGLYLVGGIVGGVFGFRYWSRLPLAEKRLSRSFWPSRFSGKSWCNPAWSGSRPISRCCFAPACRCSTGFTRSTAFSRRMFPIARPC